jgi:hypothetical protein
MTIRTIIDDIRTHGADFLRESGLAPIVKFAHEGARNDIVSFQTRGGREHIVSIIVPRNAGEDAWSRAAIAPLNVRVENLPGTPWTLVYADGVRFDDIEGFGGLVSAEECVARIIDHIEMRDRKFTPRDDLAMQICTDKRTSRVVGILREIASKADGPFVIRLTGEENDGETRVDTVILQMDDGRTIDVILGDPTIQIGISGTLPGNDRDFTVSDLDIFERAMAELGERFTRENEHSY